MHKTLCVIMILKSTIYNIICHWECEILFIGKSIHFSPGPTHISQISYFCGHHPDCDVYESDALFQRALTNFEKRFVVAGVLENFNQSIQVLEHYLPRYFKGLTNLLETNPELLQTNRKDLLTLLLETKA